MISSHRLVIKDAAWQLIGRVISALFGFLTIKIITPYLGPLQYGDYSTILKYFAIRTALADLGLYVLAVKRLGAIKESNKDPEHKELKSEYGKFVGTRISIMSVVYIIAIVVAYLLPAYTSNPYIVWGLPFGMIFSASFMFAGIQQLPLQIFWRMDKLSRSLIVARLSQIAILIPVVYFIFKGMAFDGTTMSLIAFCCIMFSVVASSIGQNIQIHLSSRKLLPLRITFNRKFTKDIIKRNWQYGVSYYLSSFHTLIVLLFLGWFFPTSGGFRYAGIRALALSLIEILLIIPSALGNSLLHKISNYALEIKRKSMGNLLLMMYRIGGIIALNFRIFADRIIRIISGKEFVGTFSSLQDRGSNQVLPFLGIVLFLSFVKQVYNYLFVAVDKQNVLLPINLVGVILGVGVGVWIIPQYGLLGGIITQAFIEILFVIGAMRVGRAKKVYPLFRLRNIGVLTAILATFACIGYVVDRYVDMNIRRFLIIVIVFNGLLLLVSRRPIKRIAKGLTVEEPVMDTAL